MRCERNPRWRRSRGSFTLIELLVVVAIIAVLAALLFPVLSAARNKAKEMVCMNNMRTWWQAINSFGLDNGRYPVPYYGSYDSNGTLQNWWSWLDLVGPYILRGLPSNYEVQANGFITGGADYLQFESLWQNQIGIACPLAVELRNRAPGDGSIGQVQLWGNNHFHNVNRGAWYSWFLNGFYSLNYNAAALPTATPSTYVPDQMHLIGDSRHPADQALLIETYNMSFFYEFYNWYAQYDYGGPGAQHVCYRHNNGQTMYVAYVDGHVAPISRSEILTWSQYDPRFHLFSSGLNPGESW